MAQEGHRRSNAHHGLADNGEDGEKGDGLGIKVQHMDLIVGKHDIKEGGEGRNQASPQGVDEELDLGGRPISGGSGRRLGHRPSPLVEASSERRANLIHGLLIEHPRLADGGLDGRRWAG